MPGPALDLHHLLEYTRVSATTLYDFSDATGAPFLKTIAGVSLSIVSMVQDGRLNRDRCVRMVQGIHQLLCGIAILCVKSGHSLSPKILDNIGSFAQTLQKFQACLRSQQELGKIKRFFKQHEITAQLEICETELNAALDVFTIQSGAGVAAAMVELEIETGQRHQELLNLLEARSESDFSDAATSIRDSFSKLSNSSSALSILPASPKIFHGREAELQDVVATLLVNPARAAILGTGGMGKTTLAVAALHHPDVMDKYAHHHFISCESASSRGDLVAIIGSHLGLEPSSQLSKAILRHFAECPPSLLILDNFETPWEPSDSRVEVEEFLSLLTDVPHLGLLVTMRGAERPGKVRWTRPFLAPLNPLPSFASRQTFLEIADGPLAEEEADLAQLIDLTGNLPLAISLMASVASFEGYSTALSRWKSENTALLSDGYDKRSSLEKSIVMSLTSPRMAASPHAQDLLSLLSLLPDGISDEDLFTSNGSSTALAKSTLLRTSLVFIDHDKRLKVLSPIREYIGRVHPPSQLLVRPLRKHFRQLLLLWDRHKQLSSGHLVSRLNSNLGNIHNVFLHGLGDLPLELREIGRGILTLETFSTSLAKGRTSLLQRVPDLIQLTGDSQLRWLYFVTCFDTPGRPPRATDVDPLVPQAIEYFAANHDLSGQANLYNKLAAHYENIGDYTKAEEFNKLGLAVATEVGDILQQLGALNLAPYLARLIGNYPESLRYAHANQRVARLAGSLLDESVALVDEAKTMCCLGKLLHALELCKKSHELLGTSGLADYAKAIEVYDAEAEIHFQKSEYAEARVCNGHVLRLTAPNRSPYYHNNSLINLAEIDITAGRDETDILRALTPAQEMSARLGWARGLLFCERLMCGLALIRGQTVEARTSYSRCLETYRRGNMAWGVLKCLEKLGDLMYKMHSVEETFHWAGTYLACARKTKNLGHTYQSLRLLGDVLLAYGDEETALNVFRAVLQGSTEMDVHRRRAECLHRIADILEHRGERESARGLWTEARMLFARSGRATDIAAVDLRLKNVAQSQE